MVCEQPSGVPLVRFTRSGVQDSLHRGSAVVVDDDAKVLMAFGDPGASGYIRSAAKPIQAIPVLTSGAADAFALDDADVAIVCGSHRGGDEQVAQVRAILSKIGLAESDLKSGQGIRDNCSGKHAGMLATCQHLGEDASSYTDPKHPHQQRILSTLAQVTGQAPDSIHVGIDGCGAPIHYLTVRHMALGYARLSRPERHFDASTAAALRRITRAMAANAGGHTGEPEYTQVLGEVRFLSKAGGCGVYCAGVVGRGIGFATKVEDGSGLPLKPVFIEVMRRLGVLSDAAAAVLRERFVPAPVNRRGVAVGEVQLVL